MFPWGSETADFQQTLSQHLNLIINKEDKMLREPGGHKTETHTSPVNCRLVDWKRNQPFQTTQVSLSRHAPRSPSVRPRSAQRRVAGLRGLCLPAVAAPVRRSFPRSPRTALESFLTLRSRKWQIKRLALEIELICHPDITHLSLFKVRKLRQWTWPNFPYHSVIWPKNSK